MATEEQISEIMRHLKENPEEIFMTDNIIVVYIANDRYLNIVGDFRGYTEEDANRRIQQAIQNLSED